jgi:hypothetical protein
VDCLLRFRFGGIFTHASCRRATDPYVIVAGDAGSMLVDAHHGRIDHPHRGVVDLSLVHPISGLTKAGVLNGRPLYVSRIQMVEPGRALIDAISLTP